MRMISDAKKAVLAALALCGLAAGLAAATVRPVSNFALGPRPVLVPGVQKMELGSGRTVLPAKFTVRIPEEEKLIAEQLVAALKRFPSVKLEKAAADGTAFCRFLLTEKGVPENPQGYRLSVDDSGIEIAARSSAGLFYGMQTLRNLLRNADGAALQRLLIRDWPDFDRRGYFFTLRWQPPKMLPELKRALDAMAALKLNWLLLDTSEVFPYQKYKLSLVKPERVYTLEQMREIIAYCRERHIEITPTMQIWSHAAWLRPHPDWEKMREGKRDDWGCQTCPLNEQAREIVEQAITEQVQLYGTKLFSPLMDEIYSGPFHTCPRCKEVPPEKLLRDYVKFIEGICKRLGVTMVVCQDAMENRYWKYGDAFRDAFDPSTRVLWWNYDDILKMVWNISSFKRFPMVGHALCGKPLNLHNMALLMKSVGSRECTATYWYYSKGGGVVSRLECETPDSLGGFANSFDYLWRLTKNHYTLFDYDGTFEMMRLMYPEKVVAANPLGVAEPVPMEGIVNAELSGANDLYPVFRSNAAVDAVRRTLAALPEHFRLITAPGGKYFGLRLAGVPKQKGSRWAGEFSFGNRKAKNFSFLLTASIPTNRFDYGRCATKGPKRYTFEPAAMVTLIYADGSRAKVELNYRREITDWNRTYGGMQMRFALRGVDDLNRHFNFGIFDVANPHLEKPVAKIAFSTFRLDGISPVLLAVSARGLDKRFPAPVKFDPAVIAKRSPAQQDPPPPVVRIRQDFEQGAGDVKVSPVFCSHDQFTAPIKAEVVDDPLSKTGNKALKVTVPPAINGGKGKTGQGYLRVSIEMPYTIEPGTKSVTFRCRISPNALTGISHINDYLIHKDGKHYWYQRAVPGTAWHTTSIPFVRANRATNPYEDKTQTGLRRVSVFFWRIPETVELWFDDFGDSTAEVWQSWHAGDEEEPN